MAMRTNAGAPHLDPVDVKYVPLAEPWRPFEQGGATIITDGTTYRCIHCGAEYDSPDAIPERHGRLEPQLVLRPWRLAVHRNGWRSQCLKTDGSAVSCARCGDVWDAEESVPEPHLRSWPESAYVPLADPWRWHRYSDGQPEPSFVTDGTTWRCTRCGIEFGEGRVVGIHNGWHNRREEGTYRELMLDEVLSFIGQGRWSTRGEMSSVASMIQLKQNRLGSWMAARDTHRVLRDDGTPTDEAQRMALEADGVGFVNGVAPPDKHVTAGDIRAHLDDLWLLPKAPRAWFVRASGTGRVGEWRVGGAVSLDATNLRPVMPGVTREELATIVEEDYEHVSYSARRDKVRDFHMFLSRMQPGDLVATVEASRLFLGTMGDSDGESSPSGTDTRLVRAVAWSDGSGIPLERLPDDLAEQLNSQRDVIDLTEHLPVLKALLDSKSREDAEPPKEKEPHLPNAPALRLPDATPELAKGLHVDVSWLQKCIDLIQDRPQLIFYGPPGTGKTYLAQALAAHIAGDKSRVRLVQFHPAYAYEDFFEGFRPTEDGSFRLKAGPMRRIVEKAREQRDVPHVLIIDEINRGNLAKVFGELYFLLEYRDKSVELLYAEDEFRLPKNVYIIGTMNTSDRSIALVDAAMRRRFAFLSLHPGEPPTNGVLRSWLIAQRRPERAADLLDALNGQIKDSDFKIGPSYFMRDAVYSDGGLRLTWETSILPLLEEHHYGEMTRESVIATYGLKAIETLVDRVNLWDPEPDAQ